MAADHFTHNRSVLPGFGLSLGVTIVYLSLLILLPLSGLAFKSSSLSLAQLWDVASGERALASYRVTFGASLLAAAINAFFGLVVAWVLMAATIVTFLLLSGTLVEWAGHLFGA